jgi:oligopeptidase B
MKNLSLTIGIALLLASCQKEQKKAISMNPDVIKAPTVAIKPHPMTLHGDTRQDNYYWLNDPK